jgi:hypothetical protein
VAGGGRAVERGAPNAEIVAQAIAMRMGIEVRTFDAELIEAAEAVAKEKNMSNGLAPAIKADARGPESPAWSKLIDLMRFAADKALERLLAADGIRVLTRVGLLGRYGQLSLIGRLAEAHRRPDAPRTATFVVLPVYSGEGAVVEVAADIAMREGSGSRLMPVPGLLPHEILEVPSAWSQKHTEPRRSSSPPLAP